MKTVLALLAVIVILNVILFAVSKLFDLLEPYALKLLFKTDVTDVLKSPEFKERKKIRTKFTHWFWSTWIVLFYATSSLSGINFYLALFGGLVLYFIGSSESNALAELTAKHREQEFLEAQDLTEKFLVEIGNRIQTLQVQDKKDDERN